MRTVMCSCTIKNEMNTKTKTVVDTYWCEICDSPYVYYNKVIPEYYPLCEGCYALAHPPPPPPKVLTDEEKCHHPGCMNENVGNCKICNERIDWNSDFAMSKQRRIYYCSQHQAEHAAEHIHRGLTKT